MTEQQEGSESAKRKSRNDIFLITGILSIIAGFLPSSFPGFGAFL